MGLVVALGPEATQSWLVEIVYRYEYGSAPRPANRTIPAI